MRQEVAKAERTWTATPIVAWVLEHHGVRISHHRMRLDLRRIRWSYQRTSYRLRHKQKPDDVEAKKLSLQTLEKGGLWTHRPLPWG